MNLKQSSKIVFYKIIGSPKTCKICGTVNHSKNKECVICSGTEFNKNYDAI